MRKVLLIILLMLLLPAIALAAQDDTSGELINSVVAIISAVAALVSGAFINLVKLIPYLGDEDKDKLATAVTQVIAVVVSVLTGYVTALLASSLGLISDSGLQAMVISALTPIFAEIRYRVERLGKVKETTVINKAERES